MRPKFIIKFSLLKLSTKMSEKLDLNWHTFSDHLYGTTKRLMETKELADVTLVSDDQHQFRVHKFILSSCSSVFHTLLENSPQNFTIYLRGIHHEDLQSILQFIYLGEATFYQKRKNEFLNIAKDLKIKEIGENVDDSDDDDFVFTNSSELNEDEKPKITNEEEMKYESVSIGVDCKVVSNEDFYSCKYCDKKLSTRGGIRLHIETVHNEQKYECQQCDFEGTQLSILKRHIQAKHEGIKYPCQQCNYKATQTSSLQRHMKSKHL